MTEAIERFWQAYLAQLPYGHAHRTAVPDAFGFGGGGALADKLAALVLSGTKQATTSLAVEFTADGEPLPERGSLSIVLGSDQSPLAVIERTEVNTCPFEEVGEDYAAIEGEGDGSLAYWRKVHRTYFASVCVRLGGQFDERTPVICQVFRVVWPQPAAR